MNDATSSALTPGDYIRKRRIAARFSVHDVAMRIMTDPRRPQHERVEIIERIEAGDAGARFDTLVALRNVFPFDFRVLTALVNISNGANVAPIAICRGCACTEFDPCNEDTFGTCWWVEPDLCSVCADPRRDVQAQAA